MCRYLSPTSLVGMSEEMGGGVLLWLQCPVVREQGCVLPGVVGDTTIQAVPEQGQGDSRLAQGGRCNGLPTGVRGVPDTESGEPQSEKTREAKGSNRSQSRMAILGNTWDQVGPD